MKLVKAYVRTFMVDEVVNALKELKAPRISAIDVKAPVEEAISIRTGKPGIPPFESSS